MALSSFEVIWAASWRSTPASLAAPFIADSADTETPVCSERCFISAAVSIEPLTISTKAPAPATTPSAPSEVPSAPKAPSSNLAWASADFMAAPTLSMEVSAR